MWSSVRSTAARQLRVSRAAKVNTGLSASSRVATRPASFVIPTSYRLVLSSRSFSGTSSEQLAAEKAVAKPRAKKSSTKAAAGAKKKKPAAKKAAAAKKPAKKAKKPAAKKKAAPKKRAKKVLTPEEKLKVQVRELKKVALLQHPKKLPDSAWTVFVAQNAKEVDNKNLSDSMRGIASQYQSLGSFEKERLDATAHQNRLANAAAYKAWVESHTPIEIDAANRARRQLRKIMPSLKVRSDIKDDRLPKLPTRAFAEFVKAKWASGDLGGERSVTVSSKLGSEWKALSAAEKKSYEDQAAADKERYIKEVKSVLHRDLYKPSSPASP